MSATNYIENKLWKGGYFSPEIMGTEVVLFSSRYSYPLVCNIIDGVSPKTSWPLATGCNSATESLFIKLKPIVTKYGGKWIYIKDPDNALSIIEWEKEINTH